jgi:hypothetical protein
MTALGIWLFDPSQDPVWQTDAKRLVFGKDYHLTPAGNRLLAEMVSDDLARAGF